MPVPVPVPAPISVPVPVPVPIPVSAPAPKPVPVPVPAPKPVPVPLPAPKPVPVPAPVPISAPVGPTNWCSNGVLHSNGEICCGSCNGQCGGVGCSLLDGGANLCCGSTIVDSGILCETASDVGCIIPPPPQLCRDGILSSNGEICCGSCGGKCGGTGCSLREGGASLCCGSSILNSGFVCKSSSDVGCIMP